VLSTSRSEYASGACRNIDRNRPPEQWNPKPCTSFEEYVASAAARSLFDGNPIFEPSLVSNTIHWFSRVKTDASSDIPTEGDAAIFVRTAAAFIESVIFATKPVYDATIGADPDSVKRTENLATAKQKTAEKLANTSIVLTPHVFNHGFIGMERVLVSMFR